MTQAAHESLVVSTVGAARHIMLNRADRRNALTPDLCRDLTEAIESAGRDSQVRAVTLRGAGGHFCVGLDLKWFRSLGATPPTALLEDGLARFQGTIRAVVRCPVPVIAVLEGSVAGFGLDLALACDLRVAAESASFASAFARMGLVPDGGSTYTLPRLTGLEHALAILVAGETIPASRAVALGLAAMTVSNADIDSAVTALVTRIAGNARSSVATIKELVRGAERIAIDQHLEHEGNAQLVALRSEEFSTRLAAFVSGGSIRVR